MEKLKKALTWDPEDRKSEEAFEQLCDHLRNIGVEAEVAPRGGRVRQSFRDRGKYVVWEGRTRLNNQSVDDILVRRRQAYSPSTGVWDIAYDIAYTVSGASSKILAEAPVSAALQARQRRTREEDLLRLWSKDQMPGPSFTPPEPEVTAKPPIIVSIARWEKKFRIFGSPKWRGGEIARLLNQDLALSGMIAQAEIANINIRAIVPGGMVEIVTPFKPPSMLDLEAYNKIAKHMKEM